MKEANLESVFSVGRLQCLGKGDAQVELNKVLVEVYYICFSSRSALS